MSSITVIINNREYIVPELTFNSMCSLEKWGISVLDRQTDILSTARGFVALLVGDLLLAGNEIEQHLINGGSITYILEKFEEALTQSSFFQKLVGMTENSANPTSNLPTTISDGTTSQI